MTKKFFLYERFDDKNNLKLIKKKFNICKIGKEKKNQLKNIEVIFTKLNFYLSSDYLKRFKNLKYILSPTTGLNHVDLNFCNKKKIKIINLDPKDRKLKRNITSTAELTITLIFLAIKKLISFFDSTKKFQWNRYLNDFNQFKEYKIGIIGYGRIGRMVKNYLKPFGFKVYIYEKKISKRNNEFVSLKFLLKNSDLITLHINGKDNDDFIDSIKLNYCKKNVVIINTSRGEVLNEKNLLTFLKKNKSASAYLDVIKNEQEETKNLNTNKIFKYQALNGNLFLLPHIGGVAKDALIYTENLVLNNFLKI